MKIKHWISLESSNIAKQTCLEILPFGNKLYTASGILHDVIGLSGNGLLRKLRCTVFLRLDDQDNNAKQSVVINITAMGSARCNHSLMQYMKYFVKRRGNTPVSETQSEKAEVSTCTQVPVQHIGKIRTHDTFSLDWKPSGCALCVSHCCCWETKGNEWKEGKFYHANVFCGWSFGKTGIRENLRFVLFFFQKSGSQLTFWKHKMLASPTSETTAGLK